LLQKIGRKKRMFEFKDDVMIRAGFHIGQRGMVVDKGILDQKDQYLVLIEKSGNFKKWISQGDLEKIKSKVTIY